MLNPSGSAVAPRHTVVIDGKAVTGSMPAIIVYVDQRPKAYRQFRRLCEHLGLGLVVDADGLSVCGEGAWEVVGNIDALGRLAGHPSVKSWHPVLNRSVHVTGAGNGPEKIKTRKAAPDPKPGAWTVLHNRFREAVRDDEKENVKKILPLLATGRGKPC